jgi:hypothetical protein
VFGLYNPPSSVVNSTQRFIPTGFIPIGAHSILVETSLLVGIRDKMYVRHRGVERLAPS